VVSLERMVTGKPFAAIFAHEGFLACVSTSVYIQGARLLKSFVTQVTFVGSDSLVDSFVLY
jgi:hypothetical protein